MNIYKLNSEELKKQAKDFNVTAYGKRCKFLSLFPYIVSILSALLVIYTILFKSDDAIIQAIYFGSFIVSFSCYVIAQFYYSKMLKDYIEQAKK